MKPRNVQIIKKFIISGLLTLKFNSNLISIEDYFVKFTESESSEELKIENDLGSIFVGGELPGEFLKKRELVLTPNMAIQFLNIKDNPPRPPKEEKEVLAGLIIFLIKNELNNLIS